jgi:hypothetical protein
MSFSDISDFKYLATAGINQNYIYEYIKRSLKSRGGLLVGLTVSIFCEEILFWFYKKTLHA